MPDSSKRSASARPIPPASGIGLRAEHYDAMLARRPPVGFLEVHSENHFGAGGRPRAVLDALAGDYPVSLHGVGLSLGSTDPLNMAHLESLRALVNRYSPRLVSEHLSWSSVDGRYFHDLLPLPYTEEAVRHVAERIERVQDYLGRRILIENLSSYVEYSHSTMPEWEFLAAVAAHSGCGILLDVNNVYVSSCNHAFDAAYYVQGIPSQFVGEMHLAGHTARNTPDGMILIDTHDRPVSAPVWQLFELSARRFADAPALIEWDTALPALEVLLEEAARADRAREDRHALAA
ncbi:MAG: hypothetical protein NFCOHLIN_00807 [Gammaproteobacteria bacterium]|nr:hypothetical protein [Gammaproteobacteria bacterium]